MDDQEMLAALVLTQSQLSRVESKVDRVYAEVIAARGEAFVFAQSVSQHFREIAEALTKLGELLNSPEPPGLATTIDLTLDPPTKKE